MSWVDTNTLRQLAEHTSVDLVKELLSVFETEAPVQIQSLENSLLEAANSAIGFEKINRTAHSMKSTFGNLGIKQMRQACIELEASAKNSDLDKTASLIDYLKTNYGQVLDDLRGQVASL